MRVASICNVAEPLLGIDRSKGERAHIRIQPGGKLFITRSIHDTINFPSWHDSEGQPRYTWEPQASRIEFGFLVDGATAGGEPKDG